MCAAPGLPCPVFLYLFSIEADKPLKHPKIDGWENGSVLRQQSKQLVVHGPITVFDIIKQRQYKQGLLRSDIYLCRQFIQQLCRWVVSVSSRYRAPAGTHLLRQIAAISGGMLPADCPQTYCQTGSHRYFPAPGPERGELGHHCPVFPQTAPTPRQDNADDMFKIAGHIRFHLPYLHRPCLSVSPSRRIVLRSLYYQFGKGMVKLQINSPLIYPVNRYPVDMH